jgi:hypothetical protein
LSLLTKLVVVFDCLSSQRNMLRLLWLSFRSSCVEAGLFKEAARLFMAGLTRVYWASFAFGPAAAL